jgi:CubicO group peptidase (beta-lactamase class C family)
MHASGEIDHGEASNARGTTGYFPDTMHTTRFFGTVVLAGAFTLDACARPVTTPTGSTTPTAPRVAAVVPAIRSSSRVPPMPTLVSASPTSVGMDRALTARLDSVMAAALADGLAPGGVLAVGRHGRLVHMKGYGFTNYAPGAPQTEARTIYDVASLTKVVVTTTAAMMLEEQGRLRLDELVATHLPEFVNGEAAKASITVRMLLTHRAGLEAYAPLHRDFRGRAEYLRAIAERPLKAAPGTETIYSDWDMIVLQLLIERITGQPLDVFASERIFQPLGLRETMFRPDTTDAGLRRRIAPTEVDSLRGGLLWGVVHDGNAWAMGGVSGHAGLFSSARDLAAFAQMMLNGGTYDGVRLLRPATIARWTVAQGAGSSRALGWDTPATESSAGDYFSPRSFGHTGFTGPYMWIDPERGLFVVLVTNRVNSRGVSQLHTPVRRAISDVVQAAIIDAPLVRWER